MTILSADLIATKRTQRSISYDTFDARHHILRSRIGGL